MTGQRWNNLKNMKQKLCILALVGLVAWSLAAFAQTTPPAGELPDSTASATATKDAASPAPTAEVAALASAPAVADAPAGDASGTNAPAAPAAAVGNAPTGDASG